MRIAIELTTWTDAIEKKSKKCAVLHRIHALCSFNEQHRDVGIGWMVRTRANGMNREIGSP